MNTCPKLSFTIAVALVLSTARYLAIFESVSIVDNKGLRVSIKRKDKLFVVNIPHNFISAVVTCSSKAEVLETFVIFWV